jgi:hypothetical protein
MPCPNSTNADYRAQRDVRRQIAADTDACAVRQLEREDREATLVSEMHRGDDAKAMAGPAGDDARRVRERSGKVFVSHA